MRLDSSAKTTAQHLDRHKQSTIDDAVAGAIFEMRTGVPEAKDIKLLEVSAQEKV
jgi:hypothetical protein